MSQNRERINPDDLDRALNDEDSVVEVRLDHDTSGGSTGNSSGVVFERRPKTPQDDRDLGLIPELLKQPELFEELIGQINRGEIRDVTRSTNPRVQAMVDQFRQRHPDTMPTPGPTPKARSMRNPIMKSLHSLGSRIKRMLP